MTSEHPLLRHARIEAANALTNAIIDVINRHVRVHGIHDPKLADMLLATLAGVVDEIKARVDAEFGELLAEMITENDDGHDE